MRAQANLPALAVALLLLTLVAVLGLGIADGAYAGATRDASERRVATSLSERIVSPDGPLTTRANVLDAASVDRLNASRLRAAFPVADGARVRVRLDDRTLVSTGETVDGTTTRRIVLVERRQAVTITPPLSAPEYETTLPRRTANVSLGISPPDGTTVSTVRADGRVVLRNGSGLSGAFDVPLSAYQTVRLTFEADGPLPPGSVRVTYHPTTATKAVLAVTVDA